MGLRLDGGISVGVEGKRLKVEKYSVVVGVGAVLSSSDGVFGELQSDEFQDEPSRFQESGGKGQAELRMSPGAGMNPLGLGWGLGIRGGAGQG